MFHTFQSSAGLRSPGDDTDLSGKPSRPAGSRRISTSNACVECRRRKIRCDGSQPCGQCQWYQHPEACGYSKPAQRVVPSRKLVDKLSTNIEQYKAVLNKLYGSKDLATLASLPREELLEMALSSSSTPGQVTSPNSLEGRATSEIHTGSDGADSLEALEQAPPEDPFWDEARKHQLRVQGISDDVNGLSMSVDRLSSYVGISSVTAALKVIVRCAPYARVLITQQTNETTLPSRAGSPPPELTDSSPLALPSSTHGQELLESYFDQVHPMMPLIDERKFWSTYLYGNRKDSQWLCLLNIVFALGSLVSSSTDNEAHYVYFNRSRQHLSLESFGSGNLEVLQALAIMSGLYMHYLNRPNEAHSLMGGALRMATTLGLHREYSERSEAGSHMMLPGFEESLSPEMRRRIWWSIFCLDAWASTTTGRPSLGRMGPSITVLKPGTAADAGPTTPSPSSPQYMEQLKMLPLIHSSVFCSIATRIQDRLVEQPLLSPTETSTYDAQLLKWYEELPSILVNEEPCPDFLRRLRLIMKWRFQNIRVILHRPYLLTAALRGCAWINMSAEEKVAIGKCRILAMKTIEDMSQECMPDLLSGWNSVWFCFQACMVCLVSLFSDTSMPEEVQKWQASIETALQFFDFIRDYSIAAKRSKDAVSKLYQAYKAYAVPATQITTQMSMSQHQYQTQTPYSMAPNPMQLGAHANLGARNPYQFNTGTPSWSSDPNFLNNFWDDMMWDTNLPDLLEHPFGLSNEFEYGGAAQDSGNNGWLQEN